MKLRESQASTVNGWLMIFVLLLSLAVLVTWLIGTLREQSVLSLVLWIIAVLAWSVCCGGFFTLQPNVAAVLTLFGKYRGTVRTSGFHWANPFLAKKKISLRAHNLNGQIIKVNDLRGNPIEIAVVVVWRVTDTVKAAFDVEDYMSYVQIQSEAALRHLAMSYPYDIFDGDELSLRGSVDEVSNALKSEVQERAEQAGVTIIEARISHLAYAQEIAGAMLQRQQADAIVAARKRIVEGAVGMVEMAIEMLDEQKSIHLDEERKAAMVSNLLVVLCGDKAVHPVVNTGTLYN